MVAGDRNITANRFVNVFADDGLDKTHKQVMTDNYRMTQLDAILLNVRCVQLIDPTSLAISRTKPGL